MAKSDDTEYAIQRKQDEDRIKHAQGKLKTAGPTKRKILLGNITERNHQLGR